jgi:hypothetical protein
MVICFLFIDEGISHGVKINRGHHAGSAILYEFSRIIDGPFKEILP